MNSEFDPTELHSSASSPQPANSVMNADLDDDFADEVLEERQGSACSMEPGCTSCE
jgi:hypothetical protein